jgi:hypothetical protein
MTATATAPAEQKAEPPQNPPEPSPPEASSFPAPTCPLPVSQPPYRRLRGYAFDPSLSTQLETAVLNQAIFKVPWEGKELQPGPVGEYLEVVDYDPASGCFYPQVDLNSPLILAQDGLPPSEGNPQFHQQMVYAVAMTTIQHFERALGRPTLWSPRLDEQAPTGEREKFVRRLRIYPHALREANAYYSPTKKALLFGYFPASSDDPGGHYPGGMVFTCLSHDIVAHETTHALLDGMHQRFIEPTHPDTLAFHEAFADIVALFQHFTFPEVLENQIAKTRGDLADQSLLGELAQQFGRAIGNYGALRDAIGHVDSKTKRWQQTKPDPQAYQTIVEPHARGALLVAAVFDAFLSIYKSRVADLLRIASSGTGVLPAGALPPDLVRRLASEAAKSAQHVLGMCIRALDYCPPVDITFGEYLRALITADIDLVPDDDLGYRVAMIEAFRRRGIYPRDVRTLSEETLRWPDAREVDTREDIKPLAGMLRDLLDDRLGLVHTREQVFEVTKKIREKLHGKLRPDSLDQPSQFESATGLVLTNAASARGITMDTNGTPRFEVHSVRRARRVGPDGTRLDQVIISITQRRRLSPETGEPVTTSGPAINFRGGVTLIVDLDTLSLRYVIRKCIADEARLKRQLKYQGEGMAGSLRATYFRNDPEDEIKEPFALLHRGREEEPWTTSSKGKRLQDTPKVRRSL